MFADLIHGSGEVRNTMSGHRLNPSNAMAIVGDKIQTQAVMSVQLDLKQHTSAPLHRERD
jgi:hypothetical protein